MNAEMKDLLAFALPVWEWTKQNWLLLLLCLLILAVLCLVIGLPLLRKYRRNHQNEKDADALKKDLQAWRNISDIASGEDKKDVARQALSSQLNMIRLLFSQGMDLLKHAGRGRYGMPWYLLLGEPKSGKSTLLKNSKLEIVCSAQEGDEKDSLAESLPLRCWLSGRAFVFDIGGKVFFDRWMGGSSAEWNLALKLIAKAHRRKPLSGIILTVPADALLADSEDLSKRKAALLVNEFQNLLGKLGMYLPCHLVVTKLDMLPGFREYFCDLSEAKADGIFGWRNYAPNGRLDLMTFSRYWNDLVEKLHSGVYSAMSGPSVHAHNQNSTESRLQLTGGMYVFPTEFEKLRKNLLIYLDRLFGTNTWLDNERLMLSGVYFTSARDGHVRLSSRLAGLKDIPLEKAVVRSKYSLPVHSLFVRDLLDKLIFTDTRNSSFTAARKIRRHIPLYALSLIFAALAFLWGYSALYEADAIRKSLQPDIEYYQGITRLFDSKALERSPLVVLNPSTEKIEIAENLPLEGNHSYTRLQFFFESQQEALKNCWIPFGFQTAGWAVFRENHYGSEDRKFIANRIQATMVFSPTVRQISRYFVSRQAETEPFDMGKRAAYQDFMNLENTLNGSPKRQTSTLPVNSYLSYLIPGLNPNTIQLLNTNAGKALDADIYDVADIIYKLPYQEAEYAATLQFFRHWEALTIYPNHPYSVMRKAIRDAAVFSENHRKVGELTQNLKEKPGLHRETLEELHRLSSEQRAICESISPFFHEGTLNWSDSAAKKIEKSAETSAAPAPREYFARKWIGEYGRQMEADYDYIMKICNQISYLSNLPVQTEMKGFVTKSHQIAKSRFAVEKDEIAQKGIALRDSLLFQSPVPPDAAKNAGKNTPQTYEVLARLLTLADALSRYPRTPLKSIADFETQKKQLDKASAEAEEQFEAYARLYAENPKIAPALADYRAILKARKALRQYEFFSELLALYPDHEDSFASLIAENAKTPADLLGMKTDLAQETFGTLEVMKAYDPEFVMSYISPIASLLPPPEKEAADGNAVKAPLSPVPDGLKPRFDKVAGMLGRYLDKYNTYWAGYVDSIQFNPQSWNDFRLLCAKLKPYQVNTLLFVAYSNSADILNEVPDALLTKNAAAQKAAFLAVLNARKQILAPHFSEICNKNVAAWRSLPEAADKAFLTLQGMTEKQRNADYLAIFDAGAKGDIPWWSGFIRSGVSFMKQEAKVLLTKKLDDCGEQLFTFPLCKDSPYAGVLTEDELTVVSGYLANLGCPAVKEPAEKGQTESAEKSASEVQKAQAPASVEPTSSPLDLALDFGKDSELPQWGAKLQGIMDALTNESKPMTFTLVVPPAKIQHKLSATLDKPFPLAMDRFPYLTVFSAGAKHRKLLLLQSEKEMELYSGLIAENELNFAFRSFSDEANPAASFKVSGDWAALHLYLSGNSYFDPQTKLVYSPLFVEDQIGGKYVLWLGFRFNKVIPLPEDWPSTRNCPDFSRLQTALKKRRAPQFDLYQEIMKAERNEKGYEKLKALLRHYEISKFPAFAVLPRPVSADSELPAAYLRYPYLEIKTPERSVRIQLTGRPDASAALFVNDEAIRFRFYRHSDDSIPAHEIVFNGPYPLLKLLTLPGTTVRRNVLSLELPVPSGTVPLELSVTRERVHKN